MTMLLVDQPYLSDLLRRTIHEHRLPVVLNPAARELGLADAPGTLTEEEARRLLGAEPWPRVLTSSENALGWLAANAGESGLAAACELFKNKIAFRRLTADLFPDLRFRAVDPAHLDDIDPEAIGHPFVLKPAVGFFSLGVQVVNRPEDWPAARRALVTHLDQPAARYPDQVLDSSSLILEEIIDGTEYAIDAYFDGQGNPVITNILQHMFSSEEDVSDRVYVTGESIVRENLASFGRFLQEVGRLAGLRNFPLHAEVRVGPRGRVVPIEINPLRFGGWCTTADLTTLAYGFNPYVEFLRGGVPDWDAIFATRGDRLFSLVVLDNSTGLAATDIAGFDLEAVARRFSTCLAVRPVDWRQHPLFGFIFTATPADDRRELTDILHSDLREFVRS